MPEKWLQFIRNSSWCGGKAAKIELELRKNPLKGCRTSGIQLLDRFAQASDLFCLVWQQIRR